MDLAFHFLSVDYDFFELVWDGMASILCDLQQSLLPSAYEMSSAHSFQHKKK